MTKIKNDEKPINVEYECHYVEFIATDDQERRLIAKLEENGFIIMPTLNAKEDIKTEESTV